MPDRPLLEDVHLLSDTQLNFQIFDYSTLIEVAEDSLREFEATLTTGERVQEILPNDEMACRCQSMKETIEELRGKITGAKDVLAAMKSEKLRRAQ